MTVKRKEIISVSPIDQALRKISTKINFLIIQGDTNDFHKVLDDYRLSCTSIELEQLKLLYQAGYEQGLKKGYDTTVEGLQDLMKKLFIEGK